MVEVTTISEAKAFAEELKKALATTDKNVTVNINLNVGERVRRPEKPFRAPVRKVDKETGKTTTVVKPYVPPTDTWSTNMTASPKSNTTIGDGNKPETTHNTCDCDRKHVYRPDVNRRNACRRRAARRFEQKRKEMLRNGIADCKITQCPHSSTPKTFHKKFVDENGNVVSVNYTYNDNPSPEDIASMYRKMNRMLRDFPFLF